VQRRSGERRSNEQRRFGEDRSNKQTSEGNAYEELVNL
jgi:hypothetical protein